MKAGLFGVRHVCGKDCKVFLVVVMRIECFRRWSISQEFNLIRLNNSKCWLSSLMISTWNGSQLHERGVLVLVCVLVLVMNPESLRLQLMTTLWSIQRSGLILLWEDFRTCMVIETRMLMHSATQLALKSNIVSFKSPQKQRSCSQRPVTKPS